MDMKIKGIGEKNNTCRTCHDLQEMVITFSTFNSSDHILQVSKAITQRKFQNSFPLDLHLKEWHDILYLTICFLMIKKDPVSNNKQQNEDLSYIPSKNFEPIPVGTKRCTSRNGLTNWTCQTFGAT